MGVGNHLGFGASVDGFIDGVDGVTRMHGVTIDQSALVDADFGIGGYFVVECWDADGTLLWETTAENGVTNVGVNLILNVTFMGGSSPAPSANWYLGLIDNNGFSALSPSDTASSHAGWSEVASANVSDATRVAWTPTTSTAQSLVNGTSSDYHMIPSSPVTVYGIFLVDNNTKGGTSGTLTATAPFSTGPQSCKTGDTLRSTYTMSAASN